MSISDGLQATSEHRPDRGGRRCETPTQESDGPPGTRLVRAPHYSELRGHGPAELARIVAANQRWRLTEIDDLVDEDGARIARSIQTAAIAMNGMGWFGGDETGEVWIDWEMTPDTPGAKATAVRSWLARHDVGEHVRSRA